MSSYFKRFLKFNFLKNFRLWDECFVIFAWLISIVYVEIFLFSSCLSYVFVFKIFDVCLGSSLSFLSNGFLIGFISVLRFCSWFEFFE